MSVLILVLILREIRGSEIGNCDKELRLSSTFFLFHRNFQTASFFSGCQFRLSNILERNIKKSKDPLGNSNFGTITTSYGHKRGVETKIHRHCEKRQGIALLRRKDAFEVDRNTRENNKKPASIHFPRTYDTVWKTPGLEDERLRT
jgi:hypothetical protein